MRRTVLILICIFFINQASSFGQRGINPEFSIEIGGGLFDFQGDLDNAPGFALLENASFSQQLILRKKIKYAFDIGFQYFRADIKANKVYTNPNTGVKDESAYDQLDASLNQVALNIYFDASGFNSNVKRRYGNPRFNYYIYSGFSFAIAKSEVWSTMNEDRTVLMDRYQARNSNVFTMTLPLGLGLKFYIVQNLSIGFDSSFILPFSDDLDATVRSTNAFDVYQNYTMMLGYTIGRGKF